MRVLVPYVELQPETYRAARRLIVAGHDVVFAYVGDDDQAYGRELASWWSTCVDSGFVVLEQDIVPHHETVDGFEACEHTYCAAPYAWTTNIGPALGCTKFGADLIAVHPEAMTDALKLRSPWGEPGHWRSLDVALMRNVLRDQHGLQPHIHLPPVEHLNPRQQLQPQFVGRSVDTQVLGRSL